MRLRALLVTLLLLIAAPSFAQTGWPKSTDAPKGDRATTPDVPPPIVVNVPEQRNGPLGWVLAAIAALTGGGGVAGIFTMALKNRATGGAVDHDAIRQTIHDALVQVVQSGALAPAVQGGLGLIPGVGGIASQFEPLIRKVVLDVLTHGGTAAAIPGQPAATPAAPTDLGGQIKALAEQAITDALKRVQQPFPASSPPA